MDYPDSPLIVQTYLQSLPFLTSDRVSTTKPDPWTSNNGKGWSGDTFVVVAVTIPADTEAISSVVAQINVYARPSSQASKQPRWWLSGSLAQQIKEYVRVNRQRSPGVFTPPGGFYDVHIMDVGLSNGERRLQPTPQFLAVHAVDIQVSYRIKTLV